MLFPPLQLARIRFTARILLTLVFMAIVALQSADAGPQTAPASVTAVPVFVSDFELYSVPPPPNSPKPQAAAPQNQQTPKTRPVSGDPELPAVQARRLMDFFATTLVDTLHKSGYTALRARAATLRKGALLRGVFAEPDEKNRICRALLGGTSANPKLLLYVGIFNLARPDQPLYQLAPEQEQSAGSQFGPVITLNNYIPLAKYELDKNPSEEDIRKICAQIAASLTALLAANAAAFSE
jgi:hypothetical protein